MTDDSYRGWDPESEARPEEPNVTASHPREAAELYARSLHWIKGASPSNVLVEDDAGKRWLATVTVQSKPVFRAELEEVRDG